MRKLKALKEMVDAAIGEVQSSEWCVVVPFYIYSSIVLIIIIIGEISKKRKERERENKKEDNK